jgi:hypothetical protein
MAPSALKAGREEPPAVEGFWRDVSESVKGRWLGGGKEREGDGREDFGEGESYLGLVGALDARGGLAVVHGGVGASHSVAC